MDRPDGKGVMPVQATSAIAGFMMLLPVLPQVTEQSRGQAGASRASDR